MSSDRKKVLASKSINKTKKNETPSAQAQPSPANRKKYKQMKICGKLYIKYTASTQNFNNTLYSYITIVASKFHVGRIIYANIEKVQREGGEDMG